MNPFGLKALQKTPVSRNPQEKGGEVVSKYLPNFGGIRDTNILILDNPSTPSEVRTDLISLSIFHRLSIEHLKVSGSEGEMVSTMTDTKVHGGGWGTYGVE